jgi:energy-coupling factor transporter ATP-binding protein EcfA2
MIQRAKFENFKALRDVEITFDSRLTVLVGPNGSGKTSVLQGIHFLTQLARTTPDPDYQLSKLGEYFRVPAPVDHFIIEATGSRRGEVGPYSIKVFTLDRNDIRVNLTVMWEKQSQWRTIATAQYADGRIGNVIPQDRPTPAFSPQRFDSSAFIRFSAARLAMPTPVESYPPLLAKDGTGLAATLNHIKNKYPEQFRSIEEAFLRVIPTATAIRFDQAPIPDRGKLHGSILLIDFKGAKGIPAQHVSSGTLFALGILTMALGPDSPNVMLLDDLDHGLHPRAQMELIDVLRELIREGPDLQIIATAHSPYILDRLEPNEVRVMNLEEDGSAVCAPLTSHPDFERWKDSMSPGEFWSTFYEDWLTRKPEAQPAS